MSVTRNDFQNELHTSAEKQYDLIVVGGGFAGVSAALSAARNGLSVLLIDRAGSLGGAAVNNLVLPFMPYFTVTEDNERIDLCRGIFAEILASLKEKEPRTTDFFFAEEDLKACTKYEDAIAAGNYEVDIHNPEGSGTSHYFFPRGAYYTIPYRALVPMGVDNLLVAGRCISSDHEAQASYRIMPICAAIGEAAGVAASVAVRDGAKNRDVSVKTVQSILRAQGAFVG